MISVADVSALPILEIIGNFESRRFGRLFGRDRAISGLSFLGQRNAAVEDIPF